MHGNEVRMGLQNMTRDRLLSMLNHMAQESVVPGPPDSGCEQGCAWCGEEVPNGPAHYDDSEDVVHAPDCEVHAAIAWLEKLPPMTNLVATIPTEFVVFDDEHPIDHATHAMTTWFHSSVAVMHGTVLHRVADPPKPRDT